LASLRAGGALAAAALCIGSTAIVAISIIAFVGREKPKCFATGFLIPLIAYGAFYAAAGTDELDPYYGTLPSTRMLRPVYDVVVARSWVDLNTGDDLPDYQPATYPARHEGGLLPAGVSAVKRSESPDRKTFMSVGHMLLAMLLGYAEANLPSS
jgi:hypothetical protein